jgi:tetratricopeptide (TPR) repeat protein
VTALRPGATVALTRRGKQIAAFSRNLSPAAPLVESIALPRGARATELVVEVRSADGRLSLCYQPQSPSVRTEAQLAAETAIEPPTPREVGSADELYLTGLHLQQYRHVTRNPVPYWQEALRRDPGDSRCNLALGRWHLRRGEFDIAGQHLRASVARLTRRNPNPADGEAHYQLGRCLRHLGRDDDAYDALAKATWNHAWQAAGFHALAEIDCTRGDWPRAQDHLDRALRVNTGNLRARNLSVLVLRGLGRNEEAGKALRALDPLDAWSCHLAGRRFPGDTQIRLDVALDCSRAGLHAEALAILADAQPEPLSGTAPLLHYYRAWFFRHLDDRASVRAQLAAAAKAAPEYCFPARLEELAILKHAIDVNPRDARAHTLLGHWLYDRRRHREAIAHWEKAARLAPHDSVVLRCLGIGYFNILRQPAKARRAYTAARRSNPTDARLLYEADQLAKRLGDSPVRRLHTLERHPDLVAARDDLTVEFCALLNQTGQPQRALPLVAARRFQPWEGGEGQALGQHVRTHLLLGRAALASGDPSAARRQFEVALAAPENLGEAKHLLANQSDLHFWLGEACAAEGDHAVARRHWREAAEFKGDFQEMSVRTFSELTYYSALAWRRLGRRKRAEHLLRDLLAYARTMAKTPAKLDYFATSLPTMQLFTDDLNRRQKTTALFLEAQAQLGLGRDTYARRLLREVLRRDPSHALAADLLTA